MILLGGDNERAIQGMNRKPDSGLETYQEAQAKHSSVEDYIESHIEYVEAYNTGVDTGEDIEEGVSLTRSMYQHQRIRKNSD